MPLARELVASSTLLVLALAGCADGSPKERYDALDAETDIVCWQYQCLDGPGGPGGKPPDIDQGLTCMHDALASGAHAVASWGVENFSIDRETRTFVFTVDHELKVFTSLQFYEDPPEFQEQSACTPLRVDDQPICGAIDHGSAVEVKALAWDDCP